MAIYNWPASTVRESHIMMKNFLWSGNHSKKKMLTVKWSTVNLPLAEGGLGIRNLRDINRAMLMKLAFKFVEGHDDFGKFMRNKFLNRDGE
ncbi:hypothetical protein ACHQM5_001343 [Ranunculus cassubicifolius]